MALYSADLRELVIYVMAGGTTIAEVAQTFPVSVEATTGGETAPGRDWQARPMTGRVGRALTLEQPTIAGTGPAG